MVTCRVTIDGMGSHSGLGEEWADNENAGTSAEAQAFKRACSCFGLGRYLYDLDGNWVDLDERKQPLSRPRLPDWALPKRKPVATGHQNGHNHTNGNGHLKPQALSAPALADLRTKVKSLCEQVGFGLARSVTRSIASMENPDEIQDAGMLSAVSMKLEDTLRGVERLRTATGVVGQTTFSQVCREMNLAGDCLDDIPDRRTLRQLIEALEREAGATPLRQNGNGHGGSICQSDQSPGAATNWAPPAPTWSAEAQRVGKLRNMKVSDVDRSRSERGVSVWRAPTAHRGFLAGGNGGERCTSTSDAMTGGRAESHPLYKDGAQHPLKVLQVMPREEYLHAVNNQPHNKEVRMDTVKIDDVLRLQDFGLERLDEDQAILRFAQRAEARIARWLDFAKGALLMLMVPDDPESGWFYIYDRAREAFYSLGLPVEGRFGGFREDEFDGLCQAFGLKALAQNPQPLRV